jgi:hypothetical protein
VNYSLSIKMCRFPLCRCMDGDSKDSWAPITTHDNCFTLKGKLRFELKGADLSKSTDHPAMAERMERGWGAF